MKEFLETTVIVAPGAKTGEVGVAFVDTVSAESAESAESASVYGEGRGVCKKQYLDHLSLENEP